MPQPARHRTAASLATFEERVLVLCPRCEGCAVIAGVGQALRLTCSSCAVSRDWDGRLHALDQDGNPKVWMRSRHSGSWIDAETGRAASPQDRMYGREFFFGAELWLRTECCGGHLLWAFNREHLDWLDSYVAADLRERSPNSPPAPSASHSQLARKLPAWMKRAEHRDEVLRNLERLRATLPV